MSFFDPIDIEAVAKESKIGEKFPPEWWGPPKNVVGGVVPFRTVLHHDEQLSIWVDRVMVYPTGLMLYLELYLPGRGYEGKDVSGYFPWALKEFDTDGRPNLRYVVPADPADYFRFGVRYGDGRTTATTTWDEMEFRELSEDPPADNEIMLARRGGGSVGASRLSRPLWVWPDPGVESVELFAKWPVCGVPEVSVSIPKEAILSGRREIVILWSNTSPSN